MAEHNGQLTYEAKVKSAGYKLYENDKNLEKA